MLRPQPPQAETAAAAWPASQSRTPARVTVIPGSSFPSLTALLPTTTPRRVPAAASGGGGGGRRGIRATWPQPQRAKGRSGPGLSLCLLRQHRGGGPGPGAAPELRATATPRGHRRLLGDLAPTCEPCHHTTRISDTLPCRVAPGWLARAVMKGITCCNTD